MICLNRETVKKRSFYDLLYTVFDPARSYAELSPGWI